MNKKYIKSILLVLIVSFIFMPSVMALDYNQPCNDAGIMNAMKIIGYIIFVVKIIVPLILIVLGMMDFTKAVTSSDDNALRKALEALIRRFIAAIAVFFLPGLLLTLVGMAVEGGDEYTADGQTYGKCTACLNDPFNNCKVYYEEGGTHSSGGRHF